MNSLKIYFGEKPFIISEAPDGQKSSGGKQVFNVSGCVTDNGSNLPDMVMTGSSIEALKNEIFSDYKVIKAGGGVVQNSKGEVLLIFRRNMWDLPKGKLDKGETIEECALREVQEETGLTQLRLIQPFTVSYHVYDHHHKKTLKENHWFLMKYSGDEVPTPQTEEDIEIVKWVNIEDLEEYYHKAFPSIKDIFDKLRS